MLQADVMSESGTLSVMTLFLLPRPPLATRLLAHKIQSPQEWEAIQALTVRKGPGVSGTQGDCDQMIQDIGLGQPTRYLTAAVS